MTTVRYNDLSLDEWRSVSSARPVLTFRDARRSGHEDADAGGEPAVLRPGSIAPARCDRSRARARRRHPARARDRGLEAIAQDFHLGTAASRAVVDEMVRNGLLERLSPSGMEYGITDKFRVLAKARVIQPLPRRDAQMLVSHIVDTAGRFNRTAVTNKYEIAAIAVFGSYMSLDEDLPDVSIGVTGRRRPPCTTAGIGARNASHRRHRSHPDVARAAEPVPARELLPAAAGNAAAVLGGVPGRRLGIRSTLEEVDYAPSGWWQRPRSALRACWRMALAARFRDPIRLMLSPDVPATSVPRRCSTSASAIPRRRRTRSRTSSRTSSRPRPGAIPRPSSWACCCSDSATGPTTGCGTRSRARRSRDSTRSSARSCAASTYGSTIIASAPSASRAIRISRRSLRLANVCAGRRRSSVPAE